jgi:hypothetical protein
MGCCVPMNNLNPRLKTERIKVLKIVGEAVGQLVVSASTCVNAIKIDRINARLIKTTDHLFQNKIVKQGVIRTEIFYVNPENVSHYITTDTPYMLAVDIPGLVPDGYTEIQNHLLDLDVKYRLVPAQSCIPGCLLQVITAHIQVIAAKWVELDVVTAIANPGFYSNPALITNTTQIIR